MVFVEELTVPGFGYKGKQLEFCLRASFRAMIPLFSSGQPHGLAGLCGGERLFRIQGSLLLASKLRPSGLAGFV